MEIERSVVEYKSFLLSMAGDFVITGGKKQFIYLFFSFQSKVVCIDCQ